MLANSLLTNESIGITTVHQTTLYYNALTGRLEHSSDPVFSGNGLSVSLRATPIGSISGAGLVIEGRTLYILMHLDGELELVARRSADMNRERMITVANENGSIHLRNNGKYISATPDGRIFNDRTTPKGWETFKLNDVTNINSKP